jgi:GR25 family glycosyltransferase involved in LPS biosynthesis
MVKKSRRNRTKKRRIQRGGNHTTVYPPESINNYIRHILYLNLDSRPDRKIQIEKELQVFKNAHIQRVPGVVSEFKDVKHRTLEITKSHLNALKIARDAKWPNVLILEDDAIWANIERAYPAFQNLVQKPYDVIMLGSQRPKFNKDTFRVEDAYGAHGYLVNSSFYNIFIKKLEELVSNFDPKKPGYIEDEIDTMVFRSLQKEYIWYAVIPSLINQLPGFSSRLAKESDYRHVEPK